MTGIVPHYYGGRYHGSVEVLGENIQGKKISELAMRVGIMLTTMKARWCPDGGEEIAFGLFEPWFFQMKWMPGCPRPWQR